MKKGNGNALMLVDAKKFIGTILLIVTFVSLYLLDRNRGDASNLIILNSILSIFTLVSLILIPQAYSSILKYRITNSDLTLVGIAIFAFICTLIFRQYINVHWVYLIVFLIIINLEGRSLNRNILQFLIFLSFLSIVYQLATSDSIGRRTLTYIDPNYSSLVIYFLGVLCFKLNKKTLSISLFSLGLLTLSRNYILAVTIFFVVNYLVKNDRVHRLICFFYRPTIIIILITFLPLIVNYWFVSVASLTDVVSNTADTKLSGSLIDNSNLHRSLANIKFIDDMFLNPFKYIIGYDSKLYIEQVFMNTPHHAIFQMILNYGYLFSFGYLILFFKTCYIFCQKSKLNCSFYAGLMSYFMILGGGINGMFIYMVAFVMIDYNEG
ncbi:conserved membrane hypothetical protein [Vibrio owensii]|nr:conserved membrane hypothetical protein [Vibrio owensii]